MTENGDIFVNLFSPQAPAQHTVHLFAAIIDRYIDVRLYINTNISERI